MVSSHWRRNFGGLVAFTLAFAMAVGLSGQFDQAEESNDVNASQMTRSRVHADTAMRHADYEEAVLHLSDLLAADPRNSHARFQLARCYYNQFVLLKRSQAGMSAAQASAAESDMAQVKRQAIATLKRCQRSHRYRDRATEQLAELDAVDLDRD